MKWTLIATWKMAAEGMRMAEANLQKSGSADQALETVITAVERDPRFHSVGYSGLPNQVGVVQLDGGYMNGDTLSIGAVGCVEKVASAFKLARHCADQQFNNFLVGEGAVQFAVQSGMEMMELLTPEARMIYEQRWAEPEPLSSYKGHDTVGVCCLDGQGTLAAGTSTSGLFMKKPGRVGDSPVCGSGFYADSEIGAAAATGVGEEIMKGCLSYEVVRRLQQGQDPQRAASSLVAEFTQKLIRKRGRAEAISLICVEKEGRWGVGTNIKFAFVVSDQDHPAQIYVAEPDQDGCTIRAWNDTDQDVD